LDDVSCAGLSFGLHGAQRRGAAVVPVWCACPLHDGGPPPGSPAARDGAAAARACGGGAAGAAGGWVASLRRGKTETFLTASGWFLAASGVVCSHLG